MFVSVCLFACLPMCLSLSVPVSNFSHVIFTEKTKFEAMTGLAITAKNEMLSDGDNN